VVEAAEGMVRGQSVVSGKQKNDEWTMMRRWMMILMEQVMQNVSGGGQMKRSRQILSRSHCGVPNSARQ